MRHWFAAAVVLACVAPHAYAQKLYRCGNTFSQVPCGQDAQEVRAAGVPQPVPTTALEELPPERHAEVQAMCERGIRMRPAWKDPDSVKITAIRRAKRTEVVTLGGKRREIAPWYAAVNAKNSFGGYVGNRLSYFLIKNGQVVAASHGDGEFGDAIAQGRCKAFIGG